LRNARGKNNEDVTWRYNSRQYKAESFCVGVVAYDEYKAHTLFFIRTSKF